MQALSKITLPELAQQSSGNVTLTRPSRISPENGLAMLRLMKETKDRFINQELPEVTQKMYLAEWTEMIQRHGLEMFRDALSTAIRENKFFPPPDKVREVIEAKAYSRSMESSARKFIRKQDAAKAQWLREREEDRLAKESAS